MDLSFNLIDYLLEESRNPYSNTEQLNEMVKSLYFSDGNKHYSFRVEPDEDRIAVGKEYFKVFSDENKRNGIPFNRVNFRDAYYIKHNMKTKEPKWVLNSGERDLLDRYLRRVRYDVDMTGFQVLICDYNKIMFKLTAEQTKTNLVSNLKYPYALPFDLEQPNYNELKYR